MRFEYKYVISNDMVTQIQEFCSANGKLDEYCDANSQYQITSIYKYIRKNSDTVEKIRLRNYSYGDNKDFYIEKKVKEKEGKYKERIKITQEDFEKLRDCSNKYEFLQMLKGLNFSMTLQDNYIEEFNTYRLFYTRNAWEITVEDFKYRLTLDSAVHTIIDGQQINLIDPNDIIFEVKGKQNAPLIISYLAKEYLIYPEKVSKFKLARKAVLSRSDESI